MSPLWRSLLGWTVAAAIAAPLALVLHECAHLLTYRAYGFPGSVLRYDGATFEGADVFWRHIRLGDFASARQIVRTGDAVVAAAMGLVTTNVALLLACGLTAIRPGIFPIAFGLASNVRVLPGVLVLAVTALGGSASTRDDEQHIAFLMGWPEAALILAGVVVMVVSGAWLVRRVPAGRRTVALVGTLFGAMSGLALYSTLLGPLLLP